jgi:hypothetical protein
MEEMKRERFFGWEDAVLLPWIVYWLLRGILGYGHGYFFFPLAMICCAVSLAGLLLRKKKPN